MKLVSQNPLPEEVTKVTEAKNQGLRERAYVYLYRFKDSRNPLYFISREPTIKGAKDRLELRFGADKVIDVVRREDFYKTEDSI